MVRVPLEQLAEAIPAFRASGVTSVEVGDVYLGEPHDTIPAPSVAPETLRESPAQDGEPESDRIARECGWIDSPGEPEELRGLLPAECP